MSRATARKKRPGDYVALRGELDLAHYTHVLLVVQSSTASFVATAPGKDANNMRFTFTNKAHMRLLRGAAQHEIKGFKREAE